MRDCGREYFAELVADHACEDLGRFAEHAELLLTAEQAREAAQDDEQWWLEADCTLDLWLEVNCVF